MTQENREKFIEMLNDERFDKNPTTWNEVVKKYNSDNSEDVADELREWLNDSRYAVCDNCDCISESESETRWKDYDFSFTGNGAEKADKIECLCDDCYDELKEKGVIAS